MTQTPHQTLSIFINRNKIRMTCDYADRNPNISADDNWAASHWKCTIIGPNKRRLTTYFSQGSAHTSAPTVADVLDCLASDASGIINSSTFEDWAADYGYDTDSRKAEKTFNACKRQAKGLKRLLGDNLFENLVYGTERL